jgi:hypothetical protein
MSPSSLFRTLSVLLAALLATASQLLVSDRWQHPVRRRSKGND